MDTEYHAAVSQLRLALMALQHRQKRLQNTRSKLSRHYNRVKHTTAMISLLEELLGVAMQDPEKWDDEPDLVPF